MEMSRGSTGSGHPSFPQIILGEGRPSPIRKLE